MYLLHLSFASLPFCVAGEDNWLIVATGVADCYYNVTDLPPGGAFRFRVACVNKAGQGPYSNWSARVSLDSSGILCLYGYDKSVTQRWEESTVFYWI